MVRRDYTLDDCAAYDYPAAINKVIEVTKQVYTPVPWGVFYTKWTDRVLMEILKRSPERYHEPLLWACLEIS